MSETRISVVLGGVEHRLTLDEAGKVYGQLVEALGIHARRVRQLWIARDALEYVSGVVERPGWALQAIDDLDRGHACSKCQDDRYPSGYHTCIERYRDPW